MPVKKKRYLESPERKKFGWSPYLQERMVIDFPIDGRNQVVAQEAVVSGKKFCFFGKFIWNYDISIIDFREYKVSR